MPKNQTKNFHEKSIADKVVELDRIANLWNKTKDQKYYESWYKEMKKLADRLASS
jgi:hypothetical protein